MTFFTEIDWTSQQGGFIASLEKGGLGAEIGLKIGDELLAINNHQVMDVIDVQYYAAEEILELLVRRQQEFILFETERAYNQSLGINFAHPTFDTDIRRCNNLCEFCFVLQMAPRFRRTLYIKDDDYRYSFLFGHYVTLTNLSDHDWWRITHMRLSPLYVSVHVTDTDMRRKFLRNGNAPDILEQLRRLSAQGIELHTQIVVVPEFNDGFWLERSIDEVARLWPAVRSVCIVPVGLTKHHKYAMRPHTRQEANSMLGYIENRQKSFRQKFGINFIYPTDEWYLVAGRVVPRLSAYDGQQLQENGLGMVRAFLEEWQDVKKEILSAGKIQPQIGQMWLVTGTLFAPILTETSAEFSKLTGTPVTIYPVTNQQLGPTITTAGLLMANDVLQQLPELQPSDLLVLPRIMFDHPDLISLDDVSPQEIANRLQCPVALADQMGDLWDVLMGQSAVLFSPEQT